MDQETETIEIIGDKGAVVFDARIRDFSDFIAGSPDAEHNSYNTMGRCTTESLEFWKNFCEEHKYDLVNNGLSCKAEWPFTSKILKDHVDERTYKCFKQFEHLGNKENIEQFVKTLNPLIETAYFLEVPVFKKMVNIALQIPLYCETGEKAAQEYKEYWGIDDAELEPENYNELIKGHEEAYANIRQAYLEGIQKIEEEKNKK